MYKTVWNRISQKTHRYSDTRQIFNGLPFPSAKYKNKTRIKVVVFPNLTVLKSRLLDFMLVSHDSLKIEIAPNSSIL